MPARQLALAWWCLMEGHISPRALRVFFAAHEMAEQRRYGRTQNSREKPVFRLDQVQRLVGGSSSERAARKLRGEVRHLAAIGLVSIDTHSIRFAKSIDALTVGEGSGEAFGAFLAQIPNRSRTVPVPRRMLRALAAGFGRAQTAYIIASLIRSVFWHRESSLYRVDGRMKGAWLAEVFQISQSAVKEARSHLVEIGWLKPLPVPQWAANKFGGHHVVNVHWSAADSVEASTEEPTALSSDSVDNSDLEEQAPAPRSGQPQPRFAPQSGTPCLNRSLSTRIKNTRRLGNHPGLPGLGNRKKKRARSSEYLAPPTIRDVKPLDLCDTERLMELHRQALSTGLARGGEAGMLDFLSLANRARMRGHKPGGLFVWLLQQKRTDWITTADEEVAAERLREHFNGPSVRHGDSEQGQQRRQLSPDEEIYERCVRVAKMHRIRDPFKVARLAYGWARDQWDNAELCHELEHRKRSMGAGQDINEECFELLDSQATWQS